MEDFKKYRRTQIAEMRPVTDSDIELFEVQDDIIIYWEPENRATVSISDPDRENGSPKIGDMIARNPKNHRDQWLVSEEYFKDNFENLQ
jgi:hypothetical protein